MFRKISIQWWRFWLAGEGLSLKTGRALLLSALTGLATGLAASAFYWLLETVQHYFCEGLAHFTPVAAAGEPELYSALPNQMPVRWMLLLLPILGSAIAYLVVRFFSAPSPFHGTDAVINAYHRNEGKVPFSTIPVRTIASAFVIGTGGSAGCEGPITQIGSACGSSIARWLHLQAPERRILLAAGMAAGLGALFRAPLAGALFASEIFYSGLDLEYEVLMPSIVASTIAYSVFACFFGWQPLFAMPDYTFTSPAKFIPYLILALVMSVGAKFYILLFRQTEQSFRKWEAPAWLKPLIGAAATGVIGFFIPDVLGAGYGIMQQAVSVSSPMAALYGTQPVLMFFLLYIGKVVATTLTVGSGNSGGLFGPALVAGAALGAATGFGLDRLFPTLALNPGAFALVGAAGFLAATVRTPIAAIILVSEIAGTHTLLLPTMWVCCLTYWLGNGWTIYRSQVRDRDCSPAHEEEDEE